VERHEDLTSQDPTGLSTPVSRRRVLAMAAAAGVAGPAALQLLSGVEGTAFASGLEKAAVANQRMALAVAFDAMDPAISSNGVTIDLFFYVFESLYRAKISDPTTFVPELAAGPPRKVNSTTYKITLRAEAKFHNGSPVTASDVAFSFSRLVAQGDKSFLGKYISNFASIVPSKTNEVTVKLKAPMALLEQRLAVIRILPKAVILGPNGKNALKYAPIGSGPYKISKAAPSAGATLTKYAGYNGPLVKNFPSAGIDVSIVPDPNAQLTGLQSARFDAISQLPSSSVQAIQKSKSLTVAVPSGHAINGLVLNAGDGKKFNDYRVRQAIMYGIDRDAVAKAAYFGTAVGALTLVPSQNADYTKPTTTYGPNPAMAKQLLAAAGYTSSNPFSFELLAGSNIAGNVAAAQLIQQQLAQIGVAVTITQGDLGALYSNVTAGKYDALYAPSSPAILGSADAEFIYRWLYYGSFATQYMFWTDPEQKQVEGLLDKAVTAPTTAAYKSVMAQVINMCAEKGPFQPIVLVSNPVAWNKRTCAAITPSHIGNIYLGNNL
jgi:peptide/nickel transport system substrate-binding protein